MYINTVKRFKPAFSLMEMMVVLLIVSIVAAASAPMINKSSIRAAAEKSPWVWLGNNNSIGYNLNGSNSTAAVGSVNIPNTRPFMFIDSGDSNKPHIALKGYGNTLTNLFTGNNSILLSNILPNINNYIDSIIVTSGANTSVGQTKKSVVIGNNIKTTGEEIVSIGSQTTANGEGSIAIGFFARQIGGQGIAIGQAARSSTAGSIAIGRDTTSRGCSVIIGDEAKGNEENSVVIGNQAYAEGKYAVIVGAHSEAGGQNSIVIGEGISTKANSTIAIGNDVRVNNASSTAIGNDVAAEGSFSTAIGYEAYARGRSSVAIGSEQCFADGNHSVAIGSGANADGQRSIAIGDQVSASAESSLALGDNSYVSPEHTHSTAIGAGAATTSSNQIVLGTADDTVYIPGKLVVDKAVLLNAKEGTTAISFGGTNPKAFREDDDSVAKFDGDVDSALMDYTAYATNQDGRNPQTGWEDFPSDRRLKNVGKVFNAGLEEIKKLEIFNYNYKKDKSKTPHVGVMAQDLQKVFPDAVTKGEDGFLRIRMEDMFYAVINAVKELDKKIDLLAQKQKKIDELEAKLEKLEKRLEALEK